VRSSRRHDWQVRLLQDLPAQGTPVTLRVCLSRWRCQNQGCARKTFSDLLPKIAPPSASTFVASLELAKQGDVALAQAANFDPIIVSHSRCSACISDDLV
jgi:chromatin segregation and condensation protein Rec8/ScpA/Scc1 (kleisin family)